MNKRKKFSDIRGIMFEWLISCDYSVVRTEGNMHNLYYSATVTAESEEEALQLFAEEFRKFKSASKDRGNSVISGSLSKVHSRKNVEDLR